MQPWRCHLHPRVAEHQGRTTRQNERSATTAHTRYFSSPAAATLHGKTQGFVPTSSPKQTPCNIRAVITMRLQQHVHIQAAIAICIHALQNTKGVSHVKSNGPQPPHTRGTFHRRLQPLYTEKRKLSFSGFPGTSPMQHSCSHQSVAASRAKPTCI